MAYCQIGVSDRTCYDCPTAGQPATEVCTQTGCAATTPLCNVATAAAGDPGDLSLRKNGYCKNVLEGGCFKDGHDKCFNEKTLREVNKIRLQHETTKPLKLNLAAAKYLHTTVNTKGFATTATEAAL